MNSTLIYSNYGEPRQRPLATFARNEYPKRGNFEIHTLQHLQQNDLLEAGQEKRLQSYEITWFKSCSGVLKLDSLFYQLKNNSVYCFSPGQLRQYDFNNDIQGYRISFTPEFLCIGATHSRIGSWLDSFHEERNTAFIEADTDMQNEMELIICQMQKEFTNYYLLRSEILSGLLNILVIYFSRKLQVRANDLSISKDTDLVRRFKALLKQHFTTRKLVADYADELCVTPNYLNRTVKKITGFTASHHIQQQIVLEAKRQAMHSNTSMKEIAYFLGFDNLAHFSKFFKNNSGMNFTSFRKGLVGG
jgi:AraC-like DNA-binding protein